MGSDLGSNFDQNSIQIPKKVCLKIAFEKTLEKYTLSGQKSTLPKSKNIAKPLEGCSKSHFSYILDFVEKVTLRPLILERFLEPKSIQDREKTISKFTNASLQRSMTAQSCGSCFPPHIQDLTTTTWQKLMHGLRMKRWRNYEAMCRKERKTCVYKGRRVERKKHICIKIFLTHTKRVYKSEKVLKLCTKKKKEKTKALSLLSLYLCLYF